MDNSDQARFTELTADIVAAYLSNNNVRPEEVGSLIGEVHTALVRAPGAAAELVPEPREPAVPLRKSITPDHIVCLEDGKKFKSLKRHLNGEHGLTPDEYRAKWGLPRDYPMVAPNYAQARSDLAKTMGLGRKASVPAADSSFQEDSAPKRARRAKAG